LEWEDLFFGRFEARARAAETAGPLRTLFTPTAAGEQLWVHWLPTEVGQLPVELIGPLAETAFYPPVPEDLTASLIPEFSVSSGDDIEAPAVPEYALRPPAPRSPTKPPSPSELDFIPVPPAPPRYSPPSEAVADPLRLPPEISNASSGQTPLWMRSLLAEALNPIPPHLRNVSGAMRGPMLGNPSPLEAPGPSPTTGPA